MKKPKIKLNKTFILLILAMIAVIVISVTSNKSRLTQYQEEVSLDDFVDDTDSDLSKSADLEMGNDKKQKEFKQYTFMYSNEIPTEFSNYKLKNNDY